MGLGRIHISIVSFLVLTGAPIPTGAQQSCTPPPSGLVGWWPGNGNANDIVGGNNGTLIGGVTFASGEAQQAFSFNGGSVVAPNQSAIDITGDLTIEAWISPASAARGYIVLKGSGNDFVNAYSLRYGAGDDQSLLLGVADGTTGTRASYFRSPAGVVPIGTFSHIAITIQGTTAQFYVNGIGVGGQYLQGVGTNSQETITPATQLTGNRFSDHGAFTIGSGNTPPIPFAGLIDEVSVYNRALSASEINRIFAAGAAGKCKSCQVNVKLLIGIPGPQYIQATFRTPDSSTLVDYAQSCGFTSFNWQQQITTDPGGSSIRPNDPSLIDPRNKASDGSLIAPPPYYDPPPGGYTYLAYNPFPFVFPSSFFAPGGTCPIPGLCPLVLPFVVSPDGTTLSFVDAPAHHNLPGVTPSTNPPAGSFLAFLSTLVGVNADNQGNVTSVTSLYSWTWNSTFNGTAGGTSQTASIYPIDPGSGTGGVTITSINGFPQTPPSVSCTATPTTPRPRDRKRILFTISGTITPGTQAIPADGTTYAVIDEDGRVRQTGSFALELGGSYSFTVSLLDARHERDDEREFAVVVTGKDQIGNTGSCTDRITHHRSDDPDE